jgi:hypothetical protein
MRDSFSLTACFMMVWVAYACTNLPEQREMEPYPRPLLPPVIPGPSPAMHIQENGEKLEARPGCWVKLFEGPGLAGENVTIHFAAEAPNMVLDIPRMELRPGSNWAERTASIKTGPGARAELYRDPYFDGDQYTIMPDMQLNGIETLGWTQLGSLRLSCESAL